MDLTGKRFGRLIAVSRAGQNKHGSYIWNCLCDCGAETSKVSSYLTSGKVKSCGCLFADSMRGRFTTHGHSSGRSRTQTYSTWKSMNARCHAPSASRFEYYGAKGISVCDRWRYSFESFLEDMGERPEEMTLDRIDPDGNYAPGNCRWATRSTQSINRSKRKGCGSQYPNVHWRKNRWLVMLSVSGKKKYFGSFEDEELAGLVAEVAREKRAVSLGIS
jgi:hypothetical protein